ncbi:jg2635 [Pararge aegeria aegeria]|uniref:Jg2635 protein n=1 Tax=Pararge aegeria aegeria TaxID=348720 RepID=A0A8S4RQL7_9NEOP|nr:jg2635 [Pararge aegeria aegeria]
MGFIRLQHTKESKATFTARRGNLAESQYFKTITLTFCNNTHSRYAATRYRESSPQTCTRNFRPESPATREVIRIEFENCEREVQSETSGKRKGVCETSGGRRGRQARLCAWETGELVERTGFQGGASPGPGRARRYSDTRDLV